jgi:hypothetical protein
MTINTQPTFTYACEGSTATFNVDATGTTNITYRWQFDSGSGFNDITDGGGYSGAGTKTLSINTTGIFGSGQYRARVSGDLAVDVISDDAQLTVNVLPSPPTGFNASSCTSPASLVVKASGASDGDYNWYDVALGGSVLETDSAFTTPSITTSATYYVTIEDTFCESTRIPVTAEIKLLTKPAITFEPGLITSGGGNVNLCEGDVQKFVAPAGYQTYTWSNGESTQEIIIDETDTYHVVVEDASGCVSPPSDDIAVVVNPYPAATITSNGSTLTASPGDAYTWYFMNEPTEGQSEQTFEINFLEYGIYAVEVTDNGCTTRSGNFTYLITAVAKNNETVKVYPNPFSKQLFIESSSKITKTEIFDITGRMISQHHINPSNEIDTRGLAEGTYLLKITHNNQQLFYRISKTH